MNHKQLFILISISGMCAVIFGAFGAHFLKEKLTATSLSAYQTGIHYQFYHTLAALCAWILLQKFQLPLFKRSIQCFLIGILLFSGSLFLLSTKSLLGISFLSFLGPITPIGGIFFILGWLYLAIAAYKT